MLLRNSQLKGGMLVRNSSGRGPMVVRNDIPAPAVLHHAFQLQPISAERPRLEHGPVTLRTLWRSGNAAAEQVKRHYAFRYTLRVLWDPPGEQLNRDRFDERHESGPAVE